MLHVRYIWAIFGVNVGKYSSIMEHLDQALDPVPSATEATPENTAPARRKADGMESSAREGKLPKMKLILSFLLKHPTTPKR